MRQPIQLGVRTQHIDAFHLFGQVNVIFQDLIDVFVPFLNSHQRKDRFTQMQHVIIRIDLHRIQTVNQAQMDQIILDQRNYQGFFAEVGNFFHRVL